MEPSVALTRGYPDPYRGCYFNLFDHLENEVQEMPGRGTVTNLAAGSAESFELVIDVAI